MKKLLVLVVIACVLSGCASSGPRARKGAGIGAILGGIAGAAVAVATGGSPEDALKGMVIGAAAGAVTGFAIGKAKDRKLAARDQAVAKYNYVSSAGYLIEVESVEFSPARVRPGEKASVKLTYAVIGPKATISIPVGYSLSVFQGENKLFGNEDAFDPVADGGGIMESTIPFVVPKEAPAGTYQIQSSVAVTSVGATSNGAAQFYVVS